MQHGAQELWAQEVYLISTRVKFIPSSQWEKKPGDDVAAREIAADEYCQG